MSGWVVLPSTSPSSFKPVIQISAPIPPPPVTEMYPKTGRVATAHPFIPDGPVTVRFASGSVMENEDGNRKWG